MDEPRTGTKADKRQRAEREEPEMTFNKNGKKTAGLSAALLVLALLLAPGLAGAEQESQAPATTYIVQAASTAEAVELVERRSSRAGPASGVSGEIARRR
jgi:uncharacterized protein HemX